MSRHLMRFLTRLAELGRAWKGPPGFKQTTTPPELQQMPHLLRFKVIPQPVVQASTV